MAIATRADPTAWKRADPDRLYEMIDGEVVEAMPMGAHEGDIATRLVIALGMITQGASLGRVEVEVLFLIDDLSNLRRRPDVAFVSAGRWPLRRRVPKVEAWPVVPDLAVEIVSPSNTANEVIEKLADYFRAGVVRVWVIYPTRTQVYEYTSTTSVRILQIGDVLDGGDLIPGFQMKLASLFEDGDVE